MNSSQVGIKILKSRYTEEWNDVSVEVVNNNILENYDISMICNETAIYLEIWIGSIKESNFSSVLMPSSKQY